MDISLFYLGWIVVTLVLGSIGVSVGSWQKPSPNRLMVFQSPWIGRVGTISFCFWIFFCPVLFTIVGMFSPRSYAPTGKVGYGLWLSLYFGMAYALAFLFLWAGSPQETKIDLEQRVCLHARGWGRRQKVWRISLDQISAVYISYHNSVYLKPIQQEGWPLRFTLGQFSGYGVVPMRPKVLCFAQEMADTLGLPVREVPAGAS